MNNEELKRKIIDVLRDNCEYELRYYPDDNYTEVVIDYEAIADALIEAGIGDVSSEKAMREFAEAFYREKCAEYDLLNYQMQKSEYRIAEAQHRAEAAEKALRNAAPRLKCRGGLGKGFCKVDKCDYYHCNNDDGCVKSHLEQAEKELAEEGKDG